MSADSSQPEPRFLSGLTHELRTPLGSILMLGELLGENRSGNLGSQDLAYVDKIQRAAADLRGLIEEVGFLDRIDTGRVTPALAEVAPRQLIDQLVQDHRPAAQARQLRLVASSAADLPAGVTTDRSLVRRILATLLDTAICTTAEGEIALALDYADEQLVFRVRDGADPVADDQCQAVFEPFGYTGPQTRRRLGGQSLALPIARRLSRLLGGDLRLSRDGHGNVFRLALPGRSRR